MVFRRRFFLNGQLPRPTLGALRAQHDRSHDLHRRRLRDAVAFALLPRANADPRGLHALSPTRADLRRAHGTHSPVPAPATAGASEEPHVAVRPLSPQTPPPMAAAAAARGPFGHSPSHGTPPQAADPAAALSPLECGGGGGAGGRSVPELPSPPARNGPRRSALVAQFRATQHSHLARSVAELRSK